MSRSESRNSAFVRVRFKALMRESIASDDTLSSPRPCGMDADIWAIIRRIVQILLKMGRLDEQLFAAGRRPLDVERREDAPFLEPAVQMQFHVTRTLELFINHVVHARAGIHQAGGHDRQAAPFFDITGCAKESAWAGKAPPGPDRRKACAHSA